jgi:hypothetical protein
MNGIKHTIKYIDIQEMTYAYKNFYRFLEEKYKLIESEKKSKTALFEIDKESNLKMIGDLNKITFTGNLKKDALEKMVINFIENLKYMGKEQ